jgi:uncharacterized protein YdbL (DUF1318 family)
MNAVLLAALLGGCVAVTINVSFPQEKLEDAASSIEDLVEGGPGTPSTAPPAGSDKPKTEGMTPGPRHGSTGSEPATIKAASAARMVRAVSVTVFPTPGKPGRQPKPERKPLIRWLDWLSATPAEAQAVPELKTRTPEVMAAIQRRQARDSELDGAAAKGCLGENNQGLVEARPGGQGCPPNVAALIAAENADRNYINKTLVEQNNMPAGDITRVQKAFAKVRREKAARGTWVQQEDGQWTKK